jgi:hypothetical protein
LHERLIVGITNYYRCRLGEQPAYLLKQRHLALQVSTEAQHKYTFATLGQKSQANARMPDLF